MDFEHLGHQNTLLQRWTVGPELKQRILMADSAGLFLYRPARDGDVIIGRPFCGQEMLFGVAGLSL